MTTHTHEEVLHGATWRSEIIQTGTQIAETVSRVETDGSLTTIYDAWYDAEVIGDASREEHLKVMTPGIVSAHIRAEELGVSIWEVLGGKIPA